MIKKILLIAIRWKMGIPFFICCILLALCLILAPDPVIAKNRSASEEPYAGEVLCQPEVYLQEQQDCLVLGPAASLTALAKLGITLPPPPLPFYHTPVELAIIPYKYIKITSKNALSVYDSLPNSLYDKPSRIISPGFRYFSYTASQDNGDGIFYNFKTNEWVWGGDVSRITPPLFQGLVFRENPKVSFAWILDTTISSSEPSIGAIKSGKKYIRFDMVYVYNSRTVGDTEWYLIGMNEWIEKRYAAKVTANAVPPEGVDNQRWIEVDLYQQTLTVYEEGRLLFATLISSGLDPFWTRPGLFKIFKKKPAETMTTGNSTDYYYLEDVPWTMYYDGARALHGAYWHSRFGTALSHGCVNISIADSRWLYDWAKIGDWVYVWDPSGKTPTDPELYSKGGP